MDTNERKDNNQMLIDKNAQINVIVNRPASNEDEIEINLERVIDRIKAGRRLYAWVILLCMVVGICAPLVLYQISKPQLYVSSVATLDYKVNGAAVKGLTAPDGSSLDLTQILSSYVLQNALDGVHLSAPISISSLRSNLTIERVLTESSRRAQEIAAKMREEKNSEAFIQAQNVSLTYDNKFIISLANGFGDEDSLNKVTLKSSELRMLLNRVVESYNDYLVQTYANLKLPNDAFGIIDPERSDILECLDQMRSAASDLYSFCEDKPSTMRAYRSWKTGVSLNDLMVTLQTIRQVDVNYLYSYIYNNNIVKDNNRLLLNYQYRLRNVQSSMDTLDKDIATVASILKNYKNDEIVVSMDESSSSKVTSTPTSYFNQLVMQQVDNFKQAARIKIRLEELNQKIERLSSTSENAFDELEAKEEIINELNRALNDCRDIYAQIKAQMEEIQTSPLYTNFINSTVASGREDSFLSANLKKMVIGAVAGGVVSCGIWFLSALLPEFRQSKPKKENGREAVA